MSDQHKQIEKLYQVLSLTLHSDGTTTLTVDAEVDGVRQVVHMAGTQQLVQEIEQLVQEIEQLRQENMALKEQLAEAKERYYAEDIEDNPHEATVVDALPEEAST